MVRRGRGGGKKLGPAAADEFRSSLLPMCQTQGATTTYIECVCIPRAAHLKTSNTRA